MLQRILFSLLICFSSISFSQTNILVLGDSLSAGYGLKQDQAWVQLLQTAYKQENQAIKLINASISGETTGGALARLSPLLDKYQPDYVLVELGGNDGLRGYPIKRLRQNLSDIVSLSKNAGAKPILMQMYITPNLGKRYATMFSDSYQKVASENNIPLMPFFLEKIADKPELMLPDGIHPNATAQPLIKDTMKYALAQIIDQTK